MQSVSVWAKERKTNYIPDAYVVTKTRIDILHASGDAQQA